MSKTIFQKIIDRDIPADIVYEDTEFICIKDINPLAPIHVLLIPKQHFTTLEAVDTQDTTFHAQLLLTARKIAAQLGIHANYKLFMNVGTQVQGVPHVHLHILGGWRHSKTTKDLDTDSESLIRAGLDTADN